MPENKLENLYNWLINPQINYIFAFLVFLKLKKK